MSIREAMLEAIPDGAALSGCPDGSPMSIRIVIGEDQALLRQGIVRLLGDAGFEVVAEAGDAPELVRKVAEHRPDVAIVDVQMPPDEHRRRAAGRARDPRDAAGTGVLVLSQYAEERYAVDLIGDDAAGVGYLLKDRVDRLRAVRRRRQAGRRRWLGGRPDGRRAHARAQAPRRSAGRALRRASARCSS